MGRVKRYKKIKACDPFANRKNQVKVIDLIHDEPPENFEKRSKRKRKRTLNWDDENQRELLLQREAIRDIRKETFNVCIILLFHTQTDILIHNY